MTDIDITSAEVFDAPNRALTSRPTGSCPWCWREALNTANEYARSLESGAIHFRCRRCKSTWSDDMEKVVRDHADPLVRLRMISLPKPVC